ncbi:response regulator [Flavobacteriaceae bacterium LSUCC0859]|nr:response regulator [Flavobacteriaceae bacterium LSUCC0859]
MPAISNPLNTLCIVAVIIGMALLLLWVWRLKKALKKLKKSQLEDQESSQFLSTLSHELRTPLYAVTSISQALLENNPKKEQLEDLYVLDKAASYLVKLINDALLIHKIDANKLRVLEEDFDLDELLSFVVKTTKNHIKDHQAEIIIKKETAVPNHFKGDPLKITQILINLVSNAMKFGANNPIHLMVKLEQNSDTSCGLLFTVKDHGKGILASDKNKILDRFHQLDTVKTEFGSGLGLSVVVQLLKSLGSQLEIDSEIDKGSSFSFKLLLKTISKVAENPKTQADYSKLNGRHILVVDDNLVNQRITKKTLEKKGMITRVCSSGKEAISILKQEGIHAVLMDLYMPEMSGEETTKIIRTFEASLPIIALTAIDKEDHWEELKNCGFSAILNKPYEELKLYQTLLNHIDADTSGSAL